EHPDRPKILVVEDDPDIRKILEIFLTERRFHVKVTDGAPAALEMLDQEPIDVILSDVRMPDMSGLELLRHLKERDPDIQLVLMSGYSSVTDAVEAIQLGAADYVEKPIDFRRLERVLQTVLEKRQLEHRTRILEQRLQGCVTFEGIVARSQRMLEVFAFVERLARYPTTALVTGESGTGKELVARALHRLSPLRGHGAAGRVPRRPVLPPERRRHPPAAAAQPGGRRRAARPPLHHGVQREARAHGDRHHAARPGDPHALPVAGERARAGQRPRARDGGLQGQRPPAGEPPAAPLRDARPAHPRRAAAPGAVARSGRSRADPEGLAGQGWQARR